MLVAIGSSILEATERAEVAGRAAEVDALVEDARAKLRLRLHLSDEAFSSGSAAIARDLGVPTDVMSDLFDIDVAARVARDRDLVDGALAQLDTGDPLAAIGPDLDLARADEGLSAAELLVVLSGIQGDVTRAAADALEDAERRALEVPPSAAVRRTLDVVRLAHDAATAVGVQLDGLSRLLLPASDDERQAGLDQLRLGVGMLSTTEMLLESRIEGRLRRSWTDARDAGSSLRSQQHAVQYAARSVSDTEPLPLDQLGPLVSDAMDRIDRYGAFATETAAEARRLASDMRADAHDAMRWAVLGAAAVAVLGLGPAAVFVRSLVTPLAGLADRAVRLSAGELDGARGEERPRGPREVVEVGAALDDAIQVLEAVESQLGTMASGDLAGATGAKAAPGRLGSLVHDSIARLSTSLRERDELARRLAHEASHDALTGLPNRGAAVVGLRQALARAGRAGAGVAVLAVELDGLKLINGTHGHEAGNEVLRTSADRLRSLVREGDVVARTGSADFVVVVEGLDETGAVPDLAGRLVRSLTAPVVIGAAVTRIGVGVGIAAELDGRSDPDALLRDAGLAAHRARRPGAGPVEVFDRAMRAELVERAALEEQLTVAMANAELTMHLQPIVTPGLVPVEAEALLRWQRPDGTLVPPAAFIPAAESSDLIIDIGRWVLADVAARLARWSTVPVLRDIGQSVNLSGRHLLSLTVVDDVSAALSAAGADPSLLTVEVTETVVLSDLGRACEHLVGLRELGVRVAVDDFGTGHTSLAHLRQLPADVLKLDRSLVVAAAEPSDERILELVVGAAHASGMVVVAEGVETEDQLRTVTAVGCDHVQGYLVARPQPEPSFRETVAGLHRAAHG